MTTKAITLVMILIAGTAGAVVVNFPDPNLEAAVRPAIGIPSGTIYDTDLVGTGFTQLVAESANITDLTGLEYCTDLTYLNLAWNQISGISALAGLTNLTILDLGLNQISDISAVAGLTNLTTLWLVHNQISDISALAGLTNLRGLNLHANHISDIGVVAGLTNLTWLWLDYNQISDISAVVANAGIGSGDSVYLDNNPLSQQALCTDIPTIEARGAAVTHDGTCGTLTIVYVDFTAGSPTGTGEELYPVDSLSAALTIVEDAGVTKINEGSTTETMTIDQVVTIEAVNGTVLIGAGARSSDNGRQWGFVSRD